MNAGATLDTLGACAAYARRRLPRLEADLLVRRAARVPRTHLYAFGERGVDPAGSAAVRSWVRRRNAGEPLAYILGERSFWELDLEVAPCAMIPRSDTETLVSAALPLIGANANVLDIGTGCGAVALAIAAERPAAHVVATDIDPQCVALATRNARRHGLAVRVRLADGFAGAKERAQVVVSNPPYVAASDPHLRRGDLRFEPRRALIAGATGLEFLARLAAEAPAHLEAGGWLVVEHGHEQGPPVTALFRQAGFRQVETRRDVEGRPRVTLGRKAVNDEQLAVRSPHLHGNARRSDKRWAAACYASLGHNGARHQ